jgi:hypothetical protein
MASTRLSAKFFDVRGKPRDPQTRWERFRSLFLIETPLSATSEEWEEWEINARRDHAFLYWLNWSLPGFAKYWHRRLWTDPVWWVRYRTIDRNHVLRVHTVKPGWMEPSDFMLHASFQLLVDHIELGLGVRNFSWFEERGIRRRRKRRYPEAGVAHLKWEISEPDCYHGVPGHTQGDHAKIKLELYDWWTRLRPLRIEPWSDSRIWKDRTIEGLTDFSLGPRGQARRDAGEMAASLEEIHSEEDQEMLMRLVSIRPGLWS